MRVNSYSLFGSNRENWARRFTTNIRQHFTLYPDWTLWIHTDSELDDKGYCPILRRLGQEGFIKITVVPEGAKTYQQRWKCMMMMWRFLPIWEGTEYVFCRDLDSILTPRQLQCVRTFIASGLAAQGINDNDGHDIPLMGGMVGFKSEPFKSLVRANSLDELVQSHYGTFWDGHGYDQVFMNSVIWPRVASSALLQRLPGPNRRCEIKKVTDADISDIPEIVRQQGDDFTNYIGACQNSFSDKVIAEFYNEHGNRQMCDIITRFEREANFTVE